MENNNSEPKENSKEQDSPDIQSIINSKESILDSINFIVDMMNSGKANPKDVYPPGRYQGD